VKITHPWIVEYDSNIFREEKDRGGIPMEGK
jgi:hypothetical protein